MTRRVAALPMYDFEEVRAATDAWWCGLARHFRAAGVRDVPDRLSRSPALSDLLGDPGLLFGQGCGYPLTHAYAGRWQVIATPCYAAEGCDGPSYSSRILVRDDAPMAGVPDLVGTVAAVNAADSHSGHIALRAAVAEAITGVRPAFRDVVLTGGHRQSLQAVLTGKADVCAVDCVSYALLEHHAPGEVAGLRTVAMSPAAPALPYIAGSAIGLDVLDRIRDGLFAAVLDPELAACRGTLLIDDVRVLAADAYTRIRELVRIGGPVAFL